jgi:hypothetical protein
LNAISARVRIRPDGRQGGCVRGSVMIALSFFATGADVMSILRRTEERRTDFMAAVARDPDNGLEVLLELYWWWGSDTADLFIEEFGQKHLEAEKKCFKSMMQTAVRDDVGQLPGLSKAQECELDRLAATVSETAFEARLAACGPRPFSDSMALSPMTKRIRGQRQDRRKEIHRN